MATAATTAPGASAVWDSLSDVERTAVQVCLGRSHGARVLPAPEHHYDARYDEALLAHLMPPEAQEEVLRSLNDAWPEMLDFIAVRTKELDHQLLLAVTSVEPPIRQVVILGAGLDPRAWRLAWPSGTHVFEVDSGSVENTKVQALSGLPVAAQRRSFVRADLGKARGSSGDGQQQQQQQGLAAALAAAGLSLEEPIVWLAEGLIGYLSEQQAAELLSVLYESSAPGSVLVMTCPPTTDLRDSVQGRGRRLHHQVFEGAEDTLARVVAAGWSAAQLNLAASLGAKYGVDNFTQAQIVARKA